MRTRMSTRFLMLALIMFGAVTIGFGQDATDTITVNVTINEVFLLVANSAADPSFIVNKAATLGAPGELPKITPAGGPTYLQYTVVSTGATTITAESDDPMPAGLILNVWSAPPTGTGGVGTPTAGGLTVGSVAAGGPTNLITVITSCATGSGATQGPAIFYTLTIDPATFSTMVPVTITPIVITYTLVDDTP